MKLSSTLRRNLHWLGSALAVIGILFVAVRLHSYWLELDFSRITLAIWLLVAALAVLYGLINLMLAMAWWHLLQYLGARLAKASALKLYGMSQLAKYVPGNIFHLAGRQALGMAAGISAGRLAKSTLWELALIAVAGALFGCWVLPLIHSGFPVAASSGLFLGSLLMVALLLKRMAGLDTVQAFLWQLVFLMITGGIFAVLLGMVSGTAWSLAQLSLIGGAYVVAWLAGLVTPGAPAGVGVREVILLLLLKGMVKEADLLMAVLLGRLITVAGDVLFFAYVSFIKPVMGTSNDLKQA